MENFAVVNGILTLSKGVLGAAGLIVLAALVIWWRTKSSHTIMMRIWTFFSSNHGSSIQSIKDFHERQAAFSQFRVTTNLKARTLARAERIIEWSLKHDEDIGDIAIAGRYFDVEKPGLHESAGKLRIWPEVCTLLLFTGLCYAAAVALMFTVPNKALLQLRETHTWMLLGENSAQPLFNQHGFKLASCGSTLANTGFTAKDVSLICEGFSPQETPEFVRSTVIEQRKIFGIFGVISLVYARLLWTSFRARSVARAMYGRLAKRHIPVKSDEMAGQED